MMAAAIAQANSRAYALADLSLAATVMLGTGDAVSVVGVLPPSDDTERLSKAATTVLDVAQASDTPKAIVGRLARAEPLESAANAYGQAMHRQPLVKTGHGTWTATHASCASGGGARAESGPRTSRFNITRAVPAPRGPSSQRASNKRDTPEGLSALCHLPG